MADYLEKTDAEFQVTGGERDSGQQTDLIRRGEGLSLLDCVTQGVLQLPKEHRAQKAFFRFLHRAGTDSQLFEQVHRLRDSVILSTVRERKPSGGTTIALTGLRGGEGTSFLSLLLGLSLGECSHRRVAILDGRFDAARFLALSDVLGLSQNAVKLQKGDTEVNGYYSPMHPNVCFLRSASAERSEQFFSDKRLGVFLGGLRQKFDFSVVELPPLLQDTACLYMLPQVDRIYLVLESAKTRLADVQRAIETARDAGRKISGVILNKQRTPLWSKFFWREFFY